MVEEDDDFYGGPALLHSLQNRDVTVIRPSDFAALLREQIISGGTL